MSDSPAHSETPVKPPQFSLAALMGTVAIISVALGFLRTFGVETIIAGFKTLAIAAIAGVLVGLATRRISETLFWALLGGMFAHLSLVGVAGISAEAELAWGICGAVSGAFLGGIKKKNLLPKLFVGACAGGLVIIIYLAAAAYASGGSFLTPISIFEMLCAFLAGASFGAAIEIVYWLEERTKLPRQVWVAGLILGDILANFFFPGLIV